MRALAQRLGAHDAAEADPVDDDDGEDDRAAGPVPSTATSRIANSTGGNAIQMSTMPRHDLVEPAAIVAGEQAEHRADDAGGRRRDEGDGRARCGCRR